MKKLWIVVLVSLLISISLFSSDVDQVFLKNGKVVEGVVQNYEIGKFVEIINLENRRQIINWEQIESLNLASDNVPVTNQNEKIKPDVKLDIDAKKGITFDQTLDSDQLRLNWERQGGIIRSTEVAVNYILTKMEMDKLSPDSTESGKMKINGAGFGYTINMNLLKFSPPNYALNKYTSYAVKLGLSACFNANMFESKYENTTIDTIPDFAIITNLSDT
ncbi:MAG: hypothetical protein Q7J16_07695 [Candidatus Cloacimonadales bacterium]|nr:hypothetical protein [Candidatus Cloacimonadales bacterium]